MTEQERIEHSKKVLLEWHQRLLADAYRPQSFMLLQSWDAQRLCDDILDAAMSLERQGRIAAAAMKSLSEPKRGSVKKEPGRESKTV